MRGTLIAGLLACLIALVPNANAEEEGPSPEDVTFVQGLLKRFGYDPGPLDGICGDLTANAVRAFHRDRNLPLDPGDVEPQAATVAGNLMTAFTNGVMSPTRTVSEVYREALAGDVAAALAVGEMYHQGLAVSLDHMLAYAWWSVAETNGHTHAAKLKQDLVSGGQISQHEITYAEALAEQICGTSEHNHDSPSPKDVTQRSDATM